MEDWEKKIIVDLDPDDIFLKRYREKHSNGLMNPFEDFRDGDIVGGLIGLATYGIIIVMFLIVLFNHFCYRTI